VIVRIMGEGQVRLDDSHFAELNELDDELLAEMEGGDEEGFRRTLATLLDAVRRLGAPLGADELEPSDRSSRRRTCRWTRSVRCSARTD